VTLWFETAALLGAAPTLELSSLLYLRVHHEAFLAGEFALLHRIACLDKYFRRPIIRC